MFGFIYGILSYLVFLGVYLGLALFSDGLLLPKTVDSGEPGSFGLALAINVGLLLVWGLQHSVMARQSFKDRLTRVLPAHLERSTYMLVSSAALLLLMVAWQPMAGVVWHVESTPLASALWALGALGWVVVPVASLMIDHFDLFGLKQTFMHWRKRSYDAPSFRAPWLYRYMRHPMMCAFFVAFWATPHMSVSHLVLSLGMSLYIYIGVHFEERSLVRQLGQAYVDYQARTPKFLPKLGGAQAPASATADA
ncbi:MAG: NnrU family protein [Myxococcales bacterium]|nr:NnrU family protein [Myxococcales bacterium]